jgi:hypothetical protein
VTSEIKRHRVAVTTGGRLTTERRTAMSKNSVPRPPSRRKTELTLEDVRIAWKDETGEPIELHGAFVALALLCFMNRPEKLQSWSRQKLTALSKPRRFAVHVQAAKAA